MKTIIYLFGSLWVFANGLSNSVLAQSFSIENDDVFDIDLFDSGTSMLGQIGFDAGFGFSLFSEDAGFRFRTLDSLNVISTKLGIFSDGRLSVGSHDAFAKVHIRNADDVSIVNNTYGHLMLGPVSGLNLSFDENEIQARNVANGSSLNLNIEGGNVVMLDGDNNFLHVRGQLKVDNLAFGDFKNVQYDDVTGLFYYDDSTIRHKRNVASLEDDWTKILDARPVSYTRPGKSDKYEFGYIAEEMDSIGLTNLVGYDREGRPDDFRYDKMVLYLTEVIKMHHKDLDEQKIINQKLSAKIKLQQEQIDLIEGQAKR